MKAKIIVTILLALLMAAGAATAKFALGFSTLGAIILVLPIVLIWLIWFLQLRLHIGANIVSTVAAFSLALWVYYFFWHVGQPGYAPWKVVGLFTMERLGMNLAWVALTYICVQLTTAALSTFSKDRWLGSIIDMLSSFAPFVLVLLAMYDHANLIRTADRWEAAIFLLVMTLIETVLSILLTLITNSRWIGFSSGASAPAIDHNHHHEAAAAAS